MKKNKYLKPYFYINYKNGDVILVSSGDEEYGSEFIWSEEDK